MPEQLNLRRAGDALVRDSVPYRPFDQERKLGSPPWKSSAPEVQAWEAAHGHDARLKCYPELGCQLVEIDLQAEVERLRLALADAADDLGKAANQFAGLLPDGRNQHIFAHKERRARSALTNPAGESERI